MILFSNDSLVQYIAYLGLKSILRNPLLFGILHRMDAVEHIGSGIKRIRNLCRDYGVAEPRIEVSEHWFTVVFSRPEIAGHAIEEGQHDTASVSSLSQVEAQEAQGLLQTWEFHVLRKCLNHMATGSELLKAAGYASRTGNFKRGLEKLLGANLIEMTIPDKPTSSKQKYRLTARGRALLAGTEENGV